MQDRGETIVMLARNLLSMENPILDSLAMPPEPAQNPSRISVSFKTLCMATILTAFGSLAVTEWIHETRRPMNRVEKTELDALIYYAAHTKGMNEKNLRREIASKIDVNSFDDMTEGDFIIARRYLQNTVK
jgi:hypothetical protein